MYIEDLVHSKIREAFRRDKDYRAFSRRGEMNTLSRDDIINFQLYRIRRMIEFARDKSPFYRKRYEGLPDIHTPSDIAYIPFTTALDLRNEPYDMLCIGLPDIASTFSHTTTGTTSGIPKKIFFGRSDADRIVESMAAVIQTVLNGPGGGSTVHIFLPNNGGPLSIAGLISMAVEKLGGRPVAGECYENTETQIRSIMEVRPDMIMGSCFRLWRITQEARAFHDLADLGVKKIFITSEYLSKPMRRYMEEYWRAEVFHHYGMTEPGFVIGVECGAHEGFHFNESDLYFEVIDPVTGRVLEDEGEGELVLTTLDRAAMPLIRYRTGDIAALYRKPCACGASTLIRIGYLPRRLNGEVFIGGDRRVYSSMFDESLHRIPELVDYRILVGHEKGKDVLTCVAEALGGESEALERALMERLRDIPALAESERGGRLDIRLRYAKWGELRRGGMSQKRRIKDTREEVPAPTTSGPD